MPKIRSLRAATVGAALVAGVAMITPANATPIYPMLFVTISAQPGGGPPTWSIDAQAPTGWSCTTPTWASGTYHLQCQPPAAPPNFENTCVWNVVKVQTTGIAGTLYGQSHCDSDPGASASTGAPGASAAGAPANVQFTYAHCRATTGATDALTRPWTVRCSVNH